MDMYEKKNTSDLFFEQDTTLPFHLQKVLECSYMCERKIA